MYCSILITVSQEEDSNLQYIPDTPAYVSWNPFLVILWSEWNSTYLTPLHMYVGIPFLWYCNQNGTVHTWHPCISKLESSSCSILITLSQEGDSNLHVQGCQVCTVPFWSQYQTKRIPTCICSGETLAYASWNPLLVILWSEWNRTYLIPLHM
jgi:hypothetical protein